mmetsp:Transcript_19961/g.36945  ORF Transcript_19961/g.36945 Transcript_19961/m.36945 type:complete len:488 (+) Transcript_19961:1292-2755(+)
MSRESLYLKVYGKNLRPISSTNPASSASHITQASFTSFSHIKSPSVNELRQTFSKSRFSTTTLHSRVQSEKVFTFKTQKKSVLDLHSRKPSLDTRAAIAKQLLSLEQESMSIKSDMLELQRDLATYDHSLCKKVSVAASLLKINRIASSLPEISNSFAQMSEREERLLQELTTGLKAMEASPAIPSSSSSTQEVWENFGLRFDVSLKEKVIHQGACSVSGLWVIYRVLGNPYSVNFHINLQTMAGDLYSLSIKPTERPDFSSAASRNNLLSKLYFILRGQNLLQLCYNPKHGVDFLAFVIELKGASNFISSVFLKANEEEVIIQIPENPSRIFVQRATLTKSKSIFESSRKKLFRKVEQHLFFNDDLKILEWLTRDLALYSSKEQFSKYLDEGFIAYTTELNSYVPLYKGVLQYRGIHFNILMLISASSQNKYRLEISFGDITRVVSQQSALMKLLTGLQLLDLSQELSTLMSSLELVLVVHKLFKL